MADVFVSYAREDRDRVAFLVEEISRRGWTVWWDRDVSPGRDFNRTINAEIAQAKCVVVAWTHASINSRWVSSEASEGLDRNILVPVLLDSVRVPVAFRMLEAAKLTGWPDRPNPEEISRVVKAISTKISQDESQRRMASDSSVSGHETFSQRIARRVAAHIVQINEHELPVLKLAEHLLNQGTMNALKKARGHYMKLTESESAKEAGYWGALKCCELLQIISKDHDAWIAAAQKLEREAREAGFILVGAESVLGGGIENAERYWSRRAANHRDSVALLSYAELLIASGLSSKAVMLLRVAEQHDPVSSPVKVQLARAYRLSGQAERGMLVLEEGLGIWPDSIPLMLCYGFAARQSGRGELVDMMAAQLSETEVDESVLRLLRGEAVVEPDMPFMFRAIGHLLTGNTDAALAAIERAIPARETLATGLRAELAGSFTGLAAWEELCLTAGLHDDWRKTFETRADAVQPSH